MEIDTYLPPEDCFVDDGIMEGSTDNILATAARVSSTNPAELSPTIFILKLHGKFMVSLKTLRSGLVPV